jgi:kumamolisin
MKADQSMTGFPRGAAIVLAASLCASTALAAPHQTAADFPFGRVITPASSQPTTGLFAHTNLHILVPTGQVLHKASQPSGNYETPASVACIYRLVRQVKGCNPQTVTAVAKGGSKVVVIVDAFDFPTAANDLAVFSQQFGLPVISSRNFKVVYAYGHQPPQDPSGGWELEESLDIEMAHSLAPNAKVILVEANSNSYNDMDAAEVVASRIAAKAGGGEVSNSWSGAEFENELAFGQENFTGANVVFFAAAGDMPGAVYPSVLPNVVAVGGTQIDRDGNGDFLDESIWYLTGGGFSQYVPLPSYQSTIASRVHNVRGVPDVAFDASPNSGVWIYDSTPYGGQALDWLIVGGTSVASPAMAAITNSAKSFAASSEDELTALYGNYENKMDFTDIKLGECGNDGSHLQGYKGWDPCTGIGAPRGRKGL